MIRSTTTITFNNDISSVPLKKDNIGALGLLQDKKVKNDISKYSAEDLTKLVKKAPVKLLFRDVLSINNLIKSLKTLKALMFSKEDNKNLKLYFRIEELARNAGVSMKAISRETCIEYNTLLKYRNNSVGNIELAHIQQLTNFFNCDIEDLFEYR